MTQTIKIVELHPTYNVPLVIVSVVIAILYSFSALNGSRNIIHYHHGWGRRIWLASGSFVMSLGVWSMHFIGMIAFQIPVEFTYKNIETLLSLWSAFIGIFIGLSFLSKNTVSIKRILLASIFMGLGISSMHYIGMLSMDMPNTWIIYHPLIILSSILVAILGSFIAFFIVIIAINQNANKLYYFISSIIMGFSIAGMHYIGMFSATYLVNSQMIVHDPEHHNGILLSCVAIGCVVILGFSLLSAEFDRKILNQSNSLKQTQGFLDFVLDNSNDLIRILNKDLNIIYASASHDDILGYNPKGMSMFCVCHQSDIDTLNTYLTKTIKEKSDALLEYRCKKSDGTYIVVEGSAHPVFDESKNISSIVMVIRDITKRKHNDILQRKAEKLDTIGKLAAGIAHEIRNPLQSLKGFVQLLEESCDSKKTYFEIMNIELKRIEEIASEFLSMAKPQPLHFKKNNINNLLNSAINLFEQDSANYHVDFRREYDQDVIIDCNESQLKKVFVNHIKNAIEAMPDGGIINISTKIKEDKVKIYFRDTGVGIAEEALNNIGEPFYTTKDTGTGLGVMVSGKIIKDHGGYTKFKSKIGQGTIVKISLPIRQLMENSYEITKI